MLPAIAGILLRGGYHGPGDVAPGASMYWGLWAYSRAYALNLGPMIDLVRASDSATLTVNALKGGALDAAAAAAFCAGTTGAISKFYDQTGNGFHVTQATSAQRAALTFNGIGTRPIATFNRSGGVSSIIYAGAQTYTQSQPMSGMLVGRRTGSFTSSTRTLAPGGSANVIYGWHNVADNTNVFGGAPGLFGGTVPDNQWHAMQCVWNGASSVRAADGASVSGVTGANSCAGAPSFGGVPTQAFGLDGDLIAGAVWPFALTSQISDLNANTHRYALGGV